MADVVIFHHALGLTPGMRQIAERLVAAGHRVMVPDLYDGETFDSLDDGVAHLESIGFDTVIDRGLGAAGAIDGPFVVIGVSLGVLPAQALAQTHSQVVGAVLCQSAISLGTFAPTWPDRVRLQLHTAEADSWADYEAATALAAECATAELFAYDTAAHLVADASTADYDPTIAEQMLERIEALLAGVDDT